MTQPTSDLTTSPQESTIWSGSPSQWLNVGWFFFCAVASVAIVVVAVRISRPLVAIAVIIPAIVALAKWLRVRSTRIEVTTERIVTTVGVFSRHRWDMELYRVKDTTLYEPFLLRLVGRANIALVSSDRSSPTLTLPALPDAEALRQKIRTHVERLRVRRGVREMDMDIER
jgi:uncharacterized membrane protein YdbT with pleckstrin-like domain